MHPIVRIMFLALAFALFLIAGLGIAHPKYNFMALGLALLTATFLFP